MSLFTDDVRKKYIAFEHEVLIADRIVEDTNKVLLEEKSADLIKVKSALFDIVILTKILEKLEVRFDLPKTIKEIRDSIAHIVDRLKKFDFKATQIKGNPWKQENQENRFKLSNSYNFQGPIVNVKLSTNGTVKAVGPYGMIDENFIWIDREGKQKHSTLQEIRDDYSRFIDSAKESLND